MFLIKSLTQHARRNCGLIMFFDWISVYFSDALVSCATPFAVGPYTRFSFCFFRSQKRNEFVNTQCLSSTWHFILVLSSRSVDLGLGYN